MPSAHACSGEAVWQRTPAPHAVDFTRLKDGSAKERGGGERSGMRVEGQARGPGTGPVDRRLIVAAILIVVAILVLLFVLR